MPTIQPSNSTSTSTTNRPTQGATLGSAIRPPKCGSTRGPSFHDAQMARIQNASDTASRMKPRNSPSKVEPHRTNKSSTSAPVKLPPLASHLEDGSTRPMTGAHSTGTLAAVAEKPLAQTQNHDAGVTMVAVWPAALSLTTARSAAPRSGKGPIRTRYRKDGP